MGQEALSSSKQNVALTCDEHKKIKKNNKTESSSSKRQKNMRMRMVMKKK